MSKIGKNLKEIRKNNNISINSLVEKLKEANIYVTNKTIYRWENDTVIPNLETIKVLSYLYNSNICELYENSKFYKALNEHEYKFIMLMRNNEKFKKLVKLLIKI